MPNRRTTAVAFALLVSAGFLLTSGGLAGVGARHGSALGGVQPASTVSFPTPIRHVFLIMLENTELGDAMRNGSYERYLAAHYAAAGQYYALEHYSLPNYLAVTSGTATNLFKVQNVTNLADVLGSAGRTWKGEEEGMPTACDSVDSGGYDHLHDPWVQYGDVVNHPLRCASHVVSFAALNLSQTTGVYPNYNLVVPNLTHDGHDTNSSVADSWLRSFLAPLVNASIFKTSVFFVAYDEGTSNLGVNNSTTGGGHVYLAAVSPYAVTGFNSTVQYTDYNILTTTEWLLGLGHTGHHDNWSTYPPMKDLFSFSNTTGK
jgi:hypothetical protein